MGRLDGSVAVITGAASGIGAATAQRFAAEGAAIAGLDIVGPDPNVVSGLEASAADVAFWPLDVRDEAEIAERVAAVIERFGQIDVLLNAAGVASAGSVDQVPVDEWDRVLDINLKGTYLVSKHVVPHMLEAGTGSIINIASIEGLVGFQGQAAYNASKGGVVLLTRNMAADYGRRGVRVNCLCPGLIETPMTAPLHDPALAEIKAWFVDQHLLGRAGRPDEVAAAALFLASADASFVTGHSLVVDGGFMGGRRFGISEIPEVDFGS